MIIVRVELKSAINGSTRELARMQLSNIGGDDKVGDYRIETLRGRDRESLDRRVVQRTGAITGHRRLDLHVWHLVGKALAKIGYVQ